jgi:multidrug transporter EmrE-like cation transporter
MSREARFDWSIDAMPPLVLALFSICLSVTAQFLFKAGARQLRDSNATGLVNLVRAMIVNPPILGGFLLYGVGAMVWLAVLARWDVSKAYPLVGAGFMLTLLVGAARGEAVSPVRIAGVVCICIGVVLVSRT